MTSYKVGTITDLLASEVPKKKRKEDPVLQALFASAPSNDSSQSRVFRTVKVADSQILKKTTTSDPVPGKGGKKNKQIEFNIKLAHKDAAAIRVQANINVNSKDSATSKGQGTEETAKKAKKLKNNKKKKLKEGSALPVKANINGEKRTNKTVASGGEDPEPGSKNKKKKAKKTASSEAPSLKEPEEVTSKSADGEGKGKKKGNKKKKKTEIQDTRVSTSPEKPEVKEKPKRKKELNKKTEIGASASSETSVASGASAKALRNQAKKERRKKRKLAKKASLAASEANGDHGFDEDVVEVKTEGGVDFDLENVKEESTEAGSAKVKVEEGMEVDETNSAQKTLVEKNAPKPKDPELEGRTIFVGNLPPETDKKDVKKIFKKFGKLETVRLRCVAPNKPTVLKKVAIYRKEHHPDKNTVAAFVRYSSRDEAKEVVEKARGTVFKDHHLILDLAVPERRKDTKKAIFVGNLDLKLTDEELWRFFEDCGTITSVRIVRDNATGLGKGFGYVNFDSVDAIPKALEKNDQQLRNRGVRIKKCVKKLKVKKNQGQVGLGKIEKSPRKGNMKVENGGNYARQSRNRNTPMRNNRRDSANTKTFKDKKARWRNIEFSGDKLAEIGKLKRRSNKPNRGELKKAKIAKMLTKTK